MPLTAPSVIFQTWQCFSYDGPRHDTPLTIGNRFEACLLLWQKISFSDILDGLERCSAMHSTRTNRKEPCLPLSPAFQAKACPGGIFVLWNFGLPTFGYGGQLTWAEVIRSKRVLCQGVSSPHQQPLWLQLIYINPLWRGLGLFHLAVKQQWFRSGI